MNATHYLKKPLCDASQCSRVGHTEMVDFSRHH